MENFLVVILFVGSIVYKIYTNYKKEMEKSAQRIPQQKQFNYPPIPTETKRDKITQSLQKKEITPAKLDYFPEEVMRLKQHKLSQQNQSKNTEQQVSLKESIDKKNESGYKFDLREAIIQSTILDRPYK